MSALSWRFGLWVMLCLLLLCSSSSVDDTCELCDLQQELESARLDLEDCRRRLGEKEGQKEGSSYLDRVCNWVTNPGREGKAVLKGTVDAFLRATRLDLAPLEDGDSNKKQVHLTVSLSQEELVRLRRFLLNDEGSVEEIQRILSSSYSLSPFSPTGTGGGRSLDLFSTFGSFLQHESFVVCQIAAVSLFVAVALWRKVKVWRVAVVVAVASVAWTWVHLYKVALSRKQATLRALGDVPKSCLVEKQGWAAAVSGAFSSALGLSAAAGRDKRCEAYYEALMVDPFWEVTPLRAATETLSGMVLRPLEMCGASAGLFLSEVIAPLPLVWKLPAMAVAAVAILLLLLMACGYKVRSPLLLFSIEPSTEKRRKIKKSPSVPAAPLPYPTVPNEIDHIESSKESNNLPSPPPVPGEEEGEDGGVVRRSPWAMFSRGKASGS